MRGPRAIGVLRQTVDGYPVGLYFGNLITLAMSVVTIFFFFFSRTRLPVTIMTHTITTIKSLNANDAIDALLALCRFARIRQRDACARCARR